MKKKMFVLVVSALAALMCALLLSACGGKDEIDVSDVAVDIERDADRNAVRVAFTVRNSGIGQADNVSLKTYMDALAKADKIAFEGNNSEYGFFVTSVMGVENKSTSATQGISWTLYIDFLTLEGNDEPYGSDYSTYEYGGETLYSASYGVSGIPCMEGHTYVFVYESYDFS